MKRVLVYCEGPTEETFTREILAPSFCPRDIMMIPIVFGGVSKYSIIKKKLSDLCKSDTSAIVTTMLDYYGLPLETPGVSEQSDGDLYNYIQGIEKAIGLDIGAPNLVPNLIVHEFEALLFSGTEGFRYCNLPKKNIELLQKIRDNVATPEHINNSPNTAPSKRILKIYPEYNKVLDGYNIAKSIGLDKIRIECRHFNEWLSKLENIFVTEQQTYYHEKSSDKT
jgi:hypothetical protein